MGWLYPYGSTRKELIAQRVGGNAEWREQVMEHHRRRAEKRKCRAIIV